MVIHRGNVDKSIKELVQDVRRVMQPFTAAELKATRRNSLKDFVAIAGPLHVSHLLMLSQTELGDNMKMVRVPRGPSLHFKLLDYSLSNDVLNVSKKRHTHQKQFLHQPLLILNGFGQKQSDDPNVKPDFHLKLLATTLQNMFPTINITKVGYIFFIKF
jgi:ribosome biogenesis protein SSF1/2